MMTEEYSILGGVGKRPRKCLKGSRGWLLVVVEYQITSQARGENQGREDCQLRIH